MSSDSEFGSYAPTTPFKALARTTKPRSKGAIAGPSSKPTGGAKSKKQQQSPEPSGVDEIAGSEEHVEISSDHEDEDDEVVAVAPPAKGKRKEKKAPTRAETTGVDGVAIGKGKGKARADPQQTRHIPEGMEIDDVELLGNLTKLKRTPTTRLRKDGSSKELDRLRKQIEILTAQKDDLYKEFDNYSKLRQTEAEQMSQQQALRYDAEVKAQQVVINDITKRLSESQPLARMGKGSVLNLLTREAADEEKRALEKEIDRLKRLTKEKDNIVTQKNTRIAELEQTEKEVRYELKIEQDRIKTLKSSSGSQGRVANGTHFDPKNTEVVSFYEDLTNLLVTYVKIEKGKFLNLEECQMTCVYTHVDENSSDDRQGKSLNFGLRLYHDRLDPDSDEIITNEKQLVKTVHYDPLELNKESPEFVQSLGFLSKPFSFQRPQLPLFLSQIYQKLGGATEDEDDQMESD